MRECTDCKQEMTTAESCDLKFRCIIIDGKILPRNTLFFDFNLRCHDCGILNRVGNLHHFGCDIEGCPKCGGQLISCTCKKESIGVVEDWKSVK